LTGPEQGLAQRGSRLGSKKKKKVQKILAGKNKEIWARAGELTAAEEEKNTYKGIGEFGGGDPFISCHWFDGE